MTGRGRRLAHVAGIVVALLAVGRGGVDAATPGPEPSPPFGRVVYRIAKAASFESLGVMMIACRHRDPGLRRFAVQFYDEAGRPISAFGAWSIPDVPAGNKIVFVADSWHFPNRPDLHDTQLGHFSIGTGRILSDARVVHCIGKIRMDGGARSPSYRDDIGVVRVGKPVPDLGRNWAGPPKRP